MEKKVSLSFCYKGNRDYVHGTDIFNESINTIYEKGGTKKFIDVDMTIRKITRNNMNLYWDNNTSGIIVPNVVISMNDGSKNLRLVLVENDKTVDCSYPYPEEEIIRAADFDKEKKLIELKTFKRFSTIEKIVALNKALLNNLFPDAPGKWYFTRIKLSFVNLENWDAQDQEIKLQFRKSLQLKITDTLIYINNKLTGNIYFSLV